MRAYLQSEAGECGLACLATVLNRMGASFELSELRHRFPQSIKGLTVLGLSRIASELGLSARAIRLEMDELSNLELPCVLHWNMNHFVVLEKVGRRSCSIMDPAVGRVRLNRAELEKSFTGVAVEFQKNSEFKQKKPSPVVPLRHLTGRVRNLKRTLAQILLLSLFLELINLASPLMSQLIVDDVLVSGDKNLLSVIVLGYALLLAVQTGVSYFRSWALLVMSQTFSLQWTNNVFSHLLRLSTSFYEKRHIGDILSRFGTLGSIQKMLTTSAVEGAMDGVMALAALVMMFMLSPQLAAVVCVAVAAYSVSRLLTLNWMRATEAGRLTLAARESSYFVETLRAVIPLRLFDRLDERRMKWQNLLVDVQNFDTRSAFITVVTGAANKAIFGIENLLIFWLGAKMVLDKSSSGGSFTIGLLLAFIGYKLQFTSRMSALIDFVMDLRLLPLYLGRLGDIVLEPKEKDISQSMDLAHLEASIEFRNVHFKHSASAPPVLKGVSFKICAGESVAICGPSGSGKTTILKIMLGLLEPTSGDVLYGGIPVRQLGLKNYRRQLGAVMQEDVLLSGSIAENISFYDPAVQRPLIEESARRASIHDDIVRMPMGYHTLLGEGGVGLSGGQKQRLLLARALYKLPRVLVLDEATSHLDIRNERAISENIRGMRMTRILVAHRPETIVSTQRTLTLQDGRISETSPAETEACAPPLRFSA